ncbi:hypothetical protein QJQ45_019376 [Haematococcus lacustris]|nr:hypothetical protein QJQ45_019376 [Haematococcus lacustris]
MGRRSQRSKKGSAIMAARVAAGLAPWTRKAGFIAKRFKELEVELQASQTQLGSDAHASQQREQRMQAQIEELKQHSVRHWLAAAGEMVGLQLTTTYYYHYHYHQAIVLLVAGLCAQAGSGTVGFDSKGDNLDIIMQFALPMRHPAPTTPYLQPQPSPTITSTSARPARVIRQPSRFATDSSLLTPPPPSTPFLPSSLSQGSASASPSTPPIQGPEAAGKAAGCSTSPNYPAVCACNSLPPPAPQSVQPGSAFHCCLGSVDLDHQ